MAVNNVYRQSESSASCSAIFRQFGAWLKCSCCPVSVRIALWVTGFIIALHIFVFNHLPLSGSQLIRQENMRIRSERVSKPHHPDTIVATFGEDSWKARAKVVEAYQEKVFKEHAAKNNKDIIIRNCPYPSLAKLSEEQKMPRAANDRHMVAPPQGGKISLVCCDTTKGTFTIIAHDKWAPKGAARFLEMVTSGYFNTGVPMMRCIKNFLCQFGLNASKEKLKDFDETIEDDPNWLPEGPTHRENALGIKRFAQGYLAYAGAGKHSRNKQLIVALTPNGPLAGGSPWEVPWGELVGEESYRTLSQIYTGYGEDGPKQGMLHNRGMTEDMKLEFPELDYINYCELLDEHDYGDI
ncbi:cyclophilin type peptidyl-prolyl cis-trans isomerase [Nitzschia inconspicua]|uniref:Cyclophilin type peptidyl-prolyl cis-trans isomerase n=1 Tax=Nitzschia inconspicua TaxID=303405 RepID=A0A9K3LRT7_9STRA|nr:cyclophilin type peptidyl-prolyl cis-trans isomerase [Nitzschia inconspicua]